MGKKKAKVGHLVKSEVFARIRPLSSGASDGHGEGEEVDKSLASFDETSVHIKDQHKTEKFSHFKAVLGPDAPQQAVFDSVAPGLLSSFLDGENNCLLFAYGQTGTGKTHTMFGTSESLNSPEPDDNWGILPRIVNEALARIQEQKETMSAMLTVSAIEFYCSAAFDLNSSERHMCYVSTEGQVRGHTSTQLSKTEEIADFIERVYGNRKVQGTKMNAGSSRSHVCIMLTFTQLDFETQKLLQTTFTVVDLAGSERPSKTGGERMSGFEVMVAAEEALKKGTELPVGAQGFMINFELTSITSAFAKATDTWKSGRQYKPDTALVPPTVWFLGGCCTGYARVGTVVCLSQSPQNGWETWFSCKWANDIAKLKAPVHKQKAVGISKALKAAEKAAKKAAKDLTNQGTSKSAMKFAQFRAGQALYTQEQFELLTALRVGLDGNRADGEPGKKKARGGIRAMLFVARAKRKAKAAKAKEIAASD